MGDISYGPLMLSIKVAAIATIIVFLTGTFLARAFARRNFSGKTIIEAFFLLPLVLPPTVVGFGLLILFGKDQLLGKWLYEYAHLQIVFLLDWGRYRFDRSCFSAHVSKCVRCIQTSRREIGSSGSYTRCFKMARLPHNHITASLAGSSCGLRPYIRPCTRGVWSDADDCRIYSWSNRYDSDGHLFCG